MKSSRTWWVWISLGLCAVLVFGAMTWLTRSMLDTERERATAEARADLQEKMRLALWRMDTMGASILLDESQREIGEPASLLPTKARFQMKRGVLTISGGGVTAEQLKQKLGVTEDLTKYFRKFTRPAVSLDLKQQQPPGETTGNPVPRYDKAYQETANATEQEVRTKALEKTLTRGVQERAKKDKASTAPYPAAAAAAPMDADNASPAPMAGVKVSPAFESMKDTPTGEELPFSGPPRVAWANGELFLIRQIFDRNGESYEGAWIDLEALKQLLLTEALDLLPTADLTSSTTPSNDGLTLASFPFHLGMYSSDSFVNTTSIPWEIRRTTAVSLSIGWFAALLAMATAALLIRGVMRLSERRASFVSAVTHELRTPLTTFRLYSEMLERGAVKEEKRGQYLRVLSREADRLAHLVENVLAFSRIERGSARSVVATTTPAQLLEPMRERFTTRLAAVGLALEMDLTTPPSAASVKVDSAAVEHILFNLIDNAAKYAASGTPPLVSIRVGTGKALEIRVIDHGPGIPARERSRIFHAFHKSAHDAAESKPGVGLGLALSRRLAHEMGGNLRYEPQPAGSCFVLSLPG